VVLATAGTVITALVAGLAASVIFDIPIALGLLVGAIISSTDAAAVFSVLRSRGMGLRGRLRPLLELESASNDPMAVFLTIGFTALVTQPDASVVGFAWLFVRQMTLGAVTGIVLALLAVRLVNWLRLEYEGLYPVLTVAIVLGIFSTTAAVGGSPFLALYLAGITMARHRFIHKRSLTRFHDGIGWLMQIAMFLILGLLVFPSQLPSVAGPGLALAAVLMLVARPVAVWLSLLGRSWNARERWLVSWVGLRGAVPIILATFPLAAGVQGADTIFNAVFFVVFLSVALQGTTIPPVARFLGLEAPGPDRTGEREEIMVGGITGRLLGQAVVPPDSWAVGRQVVELDLPPGTWVALLTRGEEVLVPQGPTVLEAGDRLTVLATPAELEQVARHLATPSGR
jgi:potassium/hydrogen antiporter